MSEQRERHMLSHMFNVAMLLIGCAVLVWMVHRFGMANVQVILRGLRGWFPIIVGIDLCTMMLDAAAIHAFMRPEARMVSFWRVLAAQASGRAVNVFVPGGAVGEATKVTMLVDRAPRGRVISSIVLYGLGNLYISVAILLVGVPVTTLLVDLPPRVQIAVWIGVGVVLVLSLILALIIRRGTLATVLDTARIVHLLSVERRERWKAKLVDVDRHLRSINPRHGGARLGLALLVTSRLTTWVTTVVTLHAVGVPITATLLVGIYSVGVLILWISNIVPLGVGVADGGNYALYGLLGASPASGVAVTMVNRVRNLTIGVIGLGVMAVMHTLNRLALARQNARMAALTAAAAEERLRTP